MLQFYSTSSLWLFNFFYCVVILDMPYISGSLCAELALSDEKCCQWKSTIQCNVARSVLVNTVAFSYTTFRGHLTNSLALYTCRPVSWLGWTASCCGWTKQTTVPSRLGMDYVCIAMVWRFALLGQAVGWLIIMGYMLQWFRSLTNCTMQLCDYHGIRVAVVWQLDSMCQVWR